MCRVVFYILACCIAFSCKGGMFEESAEGSTSFDYWPHAWTSEMCGQDRLPVIWTDVSGVQLFFNNITRAPEQCGEAGKMCKDIENRLAQGELNFPLCSQSRDLCFFIGDRTHGSRSASFFFTYEGLNGDASFEKGLKKLTVVTFPHAEFIPQVEGSPNAVQYMESDDLLLTWSISKTKGLEDHLLSYDLRLSTNPAFPEEEVIWKKSSSMAFSFSSLDPLDKSALIDAKSFYWSVRTNYNEGSSCWSEASHVRFIDFKLQELAKSCLPLSLSWSGELFDDGEFEIRIAQVTGEDPPEIVDGDKDVSFEYDINNRTRENKIFIDHDIINTSTEYIVWQVKMRNATDWLSHQITKIVRFKDLRPSSGNIICLPSDISWKLTSSSNDEYRLYLMDNADEVNAETVERIISGTSFQLDEGVLDGLRDGNDEVYWYIETFSNDNSDDNRELSAEKCRSDVSSFIISDKTSVDDLDAGIVSCIRPLIVSRLGRDYDGYFYEINRSKDFLRHNIISYGRIVDGNLDGSYILDDVDDIYIRLNSSENERCWGDGQKVSIIKDKIKLITPENGSEWCTLPLEFNWKFDVGRTDIDYELYIVSGDELFTYKTKDNSLEVDDIILSGEDLYWSVDVKGNKCKINAYELLSQSPPRIINSAEIVRAFSPLLKWESEKGVIYHIQISRDKLFEDIIDEVKGAFDGYYKPEKGVISIDSGQSLFWRISKGGDSPCFSEIQEIVRLGAPNIDETQKQQCFPPYLKWSNIAGEKYIVHVSLNDRFDKDDLKVYYSEKGFYDLTGDQIAGNKGSIFWRVGEAPRDEGGAIEFSDIMKVEELTTLKAIHPVNGMILDYDVFNLGWDYRGDVLLTVSLNRDLHNPILDKDPISGGTAFISYFDGKIDKKTAMTVYWKVTNKSNRRCETDIHHFKISAERQRFEIETISKEIKSFSCDPLDIIQFKINYPSEIKYEYEVSHTKNYDSIIYKGETKDIISEDHQKSISLDASVYDGIVDRAEFTQIYWRAREQGTWVWTDYAEVKIGPKSILNIQDNRDRFLCENPTGKFAWTPSITFNGAEMYDFNTRFNVNDNWTTINENGTERSLLDFVADNRAVGATAVTDVSVMIDNGYCWSDVVDVKIGYRAEHPLEFAPFAKTALCGHLEINGLGDWDIYSPEFVDILSSNTLRRNGVLHEIRNPGIDDIVTLELDAMFYDSSGGINPPVIANPVLDRIRKNVTLDVYTGAGGGSVLPDSGSIFPLSWKGLVQDHSLSMSSLQISRHFSVKGECDFASPAPPELTVHPADFHVSSLQITGNAGSATNINGVDRIPVCVPFNVEWTGNSIDVNKQVRLGMYDQAGQEIYTSVRSVLFSDYAFRIDKDTIADDASNIGRTYLENHRLGLSRNSLGSNLGGCEPKISEISFRRASSRSFVGFINVDEINDHIQFRLYNINNVTNDIYLDYHGGNLRRLNYDFPGSSDCLCHYVFRIISREDGVIVGPYYFEELTTAGTPFSASAATFDKGVVQRIFSQGFTAKERQALRDVPGSQRALRFSIGLAGRHEPSRIPQRPITEVFNVNVAGEIAKQSYLSSSGKRKDMYEIKGDYLPQLNSKGIPAYVKTPKDVKKGCWSSYVYLSRFVPIAP